MRSTTRDAELATDCQTALGRQHWTTAARILTEMSAQDRRALLESLSSPTRSSLRDAAIALDPTPGNVVTRDIEAVERAAPAQRLPEARRPAEDIARLSATEKLSRAWVHARAGLAEQVRREIEHLFSPSSLATMAAFAVVFIAAQLTPAGWVADALALTALSITAIFLGAMLFEIVGDIMRFFGATSATTEQEFAEAGDALARAIAKGGVAVVVALLTRGMRGRGGGGGGQPYNRPPPTAYAEAVTPEGAIIRLPQAAAEVIAANPSAVQSAAGSYAMMVPPPGGTAGGGSGSSSGGGEGSSEPRSARPEEAPPRSEAGGTSRSHASPGRPRARGTLLEIARRHGAHEEIEGEMEVFAIGTTAEGAESLAASGVSGRGGNFGGRIFAAPELTTARVFAARRVSNVGGSGPGVAGIALPRTISNMLRQRGLLRLEPMTDPPPELPRNTRQWVSSRTPCPSSSARLISS